MSFLALWQFCQGWYQKDLHSWSYEDDWQNMRMSPSYAQDIREKWQKMYLSSLRHFFSKPTALILNIHNTPLTTNILKLCTIHTHIYMAKGIIANSICVCVSAFPHKHVSITSMACCLSLLSYFQNLNLISYIHNTDAVCGVHYAVFQIFLWVFKPKSTTFYE